MVRSNPDSLIAAFDYDIHSRADFVEAKAKLKAGDYKNDVERAYLFYKINFCSFSHNMDNFKTNPTPLKLSILKDAADRLRSVVIENYDFQKLIELYDRPGSFFYCDPPYYGTEDCYVSNFGRETHERLRECLGKVKGKWLLSYNECDEIRQLYDGYNIQTAERHNNMGTEQYAELIISNYDTNERQQQITF